MPVSSLTKLAPNFTAAELGADKAAATVEIVANLREVATFLQAVRDILQVPMRITRGFDTKEENETAGGSATSDHPDGLAADWVAVGLSPFEVYQAITKAQAERKLPPFDQLIFYAADNHVHTGLGERMRGAILLRTTEGSYVQLAGSFVTKLRGYL